MRRLHPLRSRLWTGVILGAGLAGTLDMVVFHEWLQWHRLYVHTTPSRQVAIDGAFHLFTVALLVVAIVRLWRLPHRMVVPWEGQAMVAGTLMGIGGFNLFDGIVQHKILRWHQVREGVTDVLPYDLAFNGIALAVFVLGLILWVRLRRRESTPSSAGPHLPCLKPGRSRRDARQRPASPSEEKTLESRIGDGNLS